jgi:DtxR family transcriptional regulator, Mn-dependent transcriptional regulator
MLATFDPSPFGGPSMQASPQLSASLEDYLEAIFHIIQDKQAARAKDIVERLGVHNSSVTQALRVLADKELVNYAPYDLVTLTESGHAAAADVVARHHALRSFLIEVLGLDSDLAEHDACRLEHGISREVLERLRLLMAFRHRHPGKVLCWDETRGDFILGREA